jgi:hypothetical protein
MIENNEKTGSEEVITLRYTMVNLIRRISGERKVMKIKIPKGDGEGKEIWIYNNGVSIVTHQNIIFAAFPANKNQSPVFDVLFYHPSKKYENSISVERLRHETTGEYCVFTNIQFALILKELNALGELDKFEKQYL